MSCTSCGKSKAKHISIGRSITQGIKAIPRVTRQLVNKQFVVIAEKNRRYEVCKACENFIASNKRCYICTCYVDMKTILACEECPIQKWLRVGECPEDEVVFNVNQPPLLKS